MAIAVSELLFLSVRVGKGLEILVWLGLSEGQDQSGRTHSFLRNPRGAVHRQYLRLLRLFSSYKVSEETGYDLTQQLKSDDFIEMSIKEQRITLYIVTGVPEDYPFQTRTRKEISVCSRPFSVMRFAH